MTRPAKTALALGKIDLEEKTTDLRLKLKGKLGFGPSCWARRQADTEAW